ncbi:MarR family winged helix-turn-helix transcriptional regulator [Streptomyces sp. NPDC001889]
MLVGAWHTVTRYAVRRFAEHGITPGRVRVVNLLSEGALRMGGLADRLGVTGRTATLIVDDLVGEGLVERLPDPVDRRALRVGLTERGIGVLRQIERLQREVSEELFAVLRPEERDSLGRTLKRFTSTHGLGPCGLTDPAHAEEAWAFR